MLVNRFLIFPPYPMINHCVLVVREWRRNRVTNVMDAAKKSFDFFIQNILSNNQGE